MYIPITFIVLWLDIFGYVCHNIHSGIMFERLKPNAFTIVNRREYRVMGTRLYPVSKDNAVIEKLVGVPAGSVELFKKFQEELLEKFPDTDQPVYDQDQEPGYLRWSAINDHPVYGVLDHFDTYGWGKFDLWILKFFELDTCAGQTTDANLIGKLLSSTGNSPDSDQVKLLVETGGVCWG